MATKKLTRAERSAINKQRWARGERWESRDPGAPEPKPKAKKRRRQAKTSANGYGDVKGRGSGSLVDGNGNGAEQEADFGPLPVTPARPGRSNKWQHATVRQYRGAEALYAAPARLDGGGPGFGLPRSLAGRRRLAAQTEDPAHALWLVGAGACLPCRCGWFGRALVLADGHCLKCGH
jgi:hypothetical protein